MRTLLRVLIVVAGALAGMPALSATVTLGVATADTTISPNTSGAFTPAANDLLLVGVCATGTHDTTATLTSSAGTTFTTILTDTQLSWGSNHTAYLFVANSLSSATSQTVTMTAPADDWSGTNIMVARVSGMTFTGSSAVRQTEERTHTATSTPYFDLDAAVLTGNPTLGFICNLSNPAGMTAPTSWTELADIGYDSVTAGGEFVYRNSGFTGTTITWGNASATNGRAFGVELDVTAGSIPSFDGTAPSCVGLDTNTYRCTYNADAIADRIFVCIKAKDASAPSGGAAVEAGTGCSGTATENTTGSSDTIDVDKTGSDPLPLNDVYLVLEDGTSNYSSLSSQTDTRLVAPSGRQYVEKVGAIPSGGIGLFEDASPAIATGDTMDVSTLADSFDDGIGAHAITVNTDTTFLIATGGDDSRQLLTRRFADYSASAWSDASAVALAVNNLGAVFLCIDTEDLLFAKDETNAFPLDDCFNDPEGDSVSYTVDDMPSGGTLTSNETITGAFDTYGYFHDPIVHAIDQYNEEVEENVIIVVGVRLPEITQWLEQPDMWHTDSMFAVQDSFFHQAMGH